jgi:hypothetical protein
MTQIATNRFPSIGQGPRGIQARSSGGAYSQDCQNDLVDGDSLQGSVTELSGTTDAIVIPSPIGYPFVSQNYIIKTGSADAITLSLPRVGLDDNLSINIWSDTLFAHTVTLPTTGYATGTAVITTIATFSAFRGAGMTLRAYNGTWQVIGRSGVAFT